MGQQTKGGMWCPACRKPVMGVRNSHRVRKGLGVLLVPVTGGTSAVAAKGEKYVCPNCGGQVKRKRG